ncbi:uncharacterized membrane protein YqaE (UPF0057 family) [Scopulibacillus daqui]|uniref:Uncharacterized membrane protein YqaE (UPF0057 family) n=1 Tax=Scopulibacillus daqui TaxID=1469162 RepID=A0ABS2PVS7_9BACL|nr:hypothetical protein [Scopulibacillus daqui]MBM7643986.1 uncharacterized membrane protein YqaE (UPF0057 family) [Scopulibacillus daqui]
MNKVITFLRTFLAYFVPTLILSYLIFDVLIDLPTVFTDFATLGFIAGIVRAIWGSFKKDASNSA